MVPASDSECPIHTTSNLGPPSNLTLSKRGTRTSFTFRKIRHGLCRCGEILILYINIKPVIWHTHGFEIILIFCFLPSKVKVGMLNLTVYLIKYIYIQYFVGTSLASLINSLNFSQPSPLPATVKEHIRHLNLHSHHPPFFPLAMPMLTVWRSSLCTRCTMPSPPTSAALGTHPGLGFVTSSPRCHLGACWLTWAVETGNTWVSTHRWWRWVSLYNYDCSEYTNVQGTVQFNFINPQGEIVGLIVGFLQSRIFEYCTVYFKDFFFLAFFFNLYWIGQ